MAKIIILGPSQPCRNPRLIRNADALAAAGHNVHVITPIYDPRKIQDDKKIINKALWKYRGISVLNSKRKKIKVLDRVYRKLFFIIASKLGISEMGSLAYIYGYNKIIHAPKLDADFYLAQQQCTIPLAAKIAKKYNRPFGCDIEDILSESNNEPKKLFCAIEKKYLKKTSLIVTMSDAASAFLFKKYNLEKPPVVLHNTPSLAERHGFKRAYKIKPKEKPSIYWFGQTLGPHSCALELLKANISLNNPFKIFLRGNPIKAYVEKLIKISKQSQNPDNLTILPVIPPDKIVTDCMKYDILFGSQPSDDLFHQLAIGNKVFTGINAGTALLLEDTIAHKLLNRDIKECALTTSYKDSVSLEKKLKQISKKPNELVKMQKKAWNLATKKFNWESESKKLVEAVESVIKKKNCK